jgi:hypothetical protein
MNFPPRIAAKAAHALVCCCIPIFAFVIVFGGWGTSPVTEAKTVATAEPDLVPHAV